jgi:ABC-type glycerol-3-phosphate transport system substrate-binding protein
MRQRDSSVDSGHRFGASTRRRFLAAGGAVSVASLVGCLSGSGDTTTTQGPQPPWTTEDLAGQIDGDTVTIYAGTGDPQQWQDLTDVINDEFDTNIEADVFASDGESVSQRFLQERNANEDKADIVTTVSNLTDQISQAGPEEGVEKAHGWFDDGIDEDLSITDELPDKRVMSFQVSSYNGGAGICLPVSEDVFDSQGLDYPETYNDLFDDQYEGLDIAFSGYVSPEQVGWIAKYHAEQRDMDHVEWAQSLMDHFNVIGVDSHSAGTRAVGRGDAAMMLYNWPWVVAPFVNNSDLAVRGIFTDPVKANAMEGPMMINKNAPNSWAARFFVSAMLEKPVQKRMLTDVVDQVPVRTDLDLSGMDVPEFTKRRLNAELTRIGYWEGSEYSTAGQEVIDTDIFSP